MEQISRRGFISWIVGILAASQSALGLRSPSEVDKYPIATFPGINKIMSWSYTPTHGICPSLVHLEIEPQSNMPTNAGTFRVRAEPWGIELPGCRAICGDLDSEGRVTKLYLYDRRWQWRFGCISGDYNCQFMLPRPLRSVRDLASILLTKMGETDFDVSALPNNVFPDTHWKNHVPAEQLQSLVNSVRFAVVLGADDRVRFQKFEQLEVSS